MLKNGKTFDYTVRVISKPTTPTWRLPLRAGIFVSTGMFLFVAVCFGRQLANPEQKQDAPGWEEHFEAAQAAQKNQDYPSAEREYRLVLESKPDFAEVHMNLGLLSRLQGHRSEAMSEFRRALKLKPGLSGANFFLGVGYCELNQGALAIPYLKAAARAQPGHADILSWLATAQEMTGNVHAEIATLQKALAIQPADVDLLYLLGHAYERLGKDEVVALERSTPGSARAEQLLAESYAASSEWPSAILRYQNALAASEDTSGLHVGLGEVLLRQGKVRRATEEFEAELNRHPDSLRALVRRGEVRLIQGDTDAALQDWEHALQIDAARAERILGIRETGFGDAAFEQLPEALRREVEANAPKLQGHTSAASHFALAFLARQENNASMAAAQIELAHSSGIRTPDPGACSEAKVRRLLSDGHFSEMSPCARRVLKPASSPDFRLQIARALFEAGEYEASLEVLSQLPPAARNSPEIDFWRARGYEKLATAAYLRLYQAGPNSHRMHQLMGDLAATKNDDRKAIEEYQAAVAMKPSLPNLHYSLGHVFWKDLKVKEAREEFEAELKLSPRHPGALNELGDTYLLDHQPDLALAHLTQAVEMEPHNPDFHRDLGTAYSELRMYEKAVTEFQLAVAGDYDGSVHYKLARAYQAMGEKEKAAREFALSAAMNEESHKKLEKQTERLIQIDKWTHE